MKKVLLSILVAVLLFSIASVGLAEELKVHVNGERVEFDTQPIIVDARTMVPIRAIAEALHIHVQWNQENQEVSLSTDEMINLTVGKQIASSAYYGELKLDVAPFIKDDRVFIPLRFISEFFDRNVIYSRENNTILIDEMIQNGWYVDINNNYKIKVFKDFEFAGRALGEEDGLGYAYEISTLHLEDLTMPVDANRMSYRFTPYKEDFNKQLEEMIQSFSGKKGYKMLEQTDYSYLIYHEFDEGRYNQNRKSLTYILHNNESILVAYFDAIDEYFDKYKEEIIENIKSIQPIDERITSIPTPVDNANINNYELMYRLNIL